MCTQGERDCNPEQKLQGGSCKQPAVQSPAQLASDLNHNIFYVWFVRPYQSRVPSMDSNLRCGLLDHTIL